MFVLGIDPGLARCGFGAVRRVAGGALSLEDVGVITTGPEAELPMRLLDVFRGLQGLIARHRPDVVAVERLFFQTNVRTAMVVGQASGLVLLAAAEAGLPVVQYTANEVKYTVAGYGAAPKAQVQKMVAAMLGLSEVPKPDDAADGVALALCHLAHARLGAMAKNATIAGSVASPFGNARIATSLGGVPIKATDPAELARERSALAGRTTVVTRKPR